MQIAFLTLFLGLVRGPRPVALTASPGVARIELVLDGRSAGTVSGPAWTGRIDFGRALLPHRLEARGLAADGSEVVRTEQWVNLPRPPAEVDLVLEPGAQGRPSAVRLVWENRTGEPPTAMRLTLDHRPLPLDHGRAAIPALPAGGAHVLAAELRFGNGWTARREVVLTDDPASRVATELTAVPVRATRPGKPLVESDLQGLLTAGGRPLTVAAVEREPAQVFIVRAPGVEGDIHRKLALAADSLGVYGHFPPDARTRFHLMAIVPTRHQTASGATQTFDGSLDMAVSGHDFSLLLASERLPSERDGRPQLADATAVAGLEAYSHQTPRAVVLILKGEANDGSRLTPADVRGYLASIGVPLFVWSVDPAGRFNPAWGEIDDISSAWGVRRAYDRLERELRAQQIVWLEGRHLPQEISLAPAARGFELLSTPSPAGGGARRAPPAADAVLAGNLLCPPAGTPRRVRSSRR